MTIPGIDVIGVAVGVLLVNGQGQIFLTKRGPQATNERGTWEIPGGKVQFGERLADAARREMREEYGIDISLLHQFPAQDHLIPDEHQHWVPTCFLACISGNETPTILEPGKCTEIGWFDLDQLPAPISIITKLDLAAYQEYRTSGRKI